MKNLLLILTCALIGCVHVDPEQCNPCQVKVEDRCFWASDSYTDESGVHCIEPPIRCNYKDCSLGEETIYKENL